MTKFKGDNGTQYSAISLDMSLSEYLGKYQGERFLNMTHFLECMDGKMPMEFWQWLLEPVKPKEGKMIVSCKRDENKKALLWHYADRLAVCADVFCSLDNDSQDYIIKARKQSAPIWWRGDLIENFKTIARESYRYGQLDDDRKVNYRQSCMKQVKRMLSHGN